MKSLMKACVLSVAILALMCGVAGAYEFNAQGSALVPNLTFIQTTRNNFIYQYINVTNITGSTVQCRATVYDHNGNDITSLIKVYSGSEGADNFSTISTGTGDFEIPAHSTRMFCLTEFPKMVIVGYAVIEWNSSDSQLRKALIAGGRFLRRTNVNRESGGNYLINNGQPF